MAVRILLLVGLVLGGLSFLLLFVLALLFMLAASYQTDGTGTFNDMILWILERVFLDGLDPRMSLGAMFGKALWTGMCSLGLLPLGLHSKFEIPKRELHAKLPCRRGRPRGQAAGPTSSDRGKPGKTRT